MFNKDKKNLIPIKFISIIIFSLILSMNLFSLQRIFASSGEQNRRKIEFQEVYDYRDDDNNDFFLEKDKKLSKINDNLVSLEKKKKTSSKNNIKLDELKKVVCNFIEKAVSENITQDDENVKKGQDLFITLESTAFQIENQNNEKIDLTNYKNNDSVKLKTKIFINEQCDPNIENNYAIDYVEEKHDKQKNESYSYVIHNQCNNSKEFFIVSEIVFQTIMPKIK
ncbi:hypothetical protein [Candidatus Phytoplasma palmae]|uniref:hypothetical protein n=1 Tax=Candidatus Phytoplasma palmae TaxID=85624 RepID=UPI003990B82E